VAEDDRGATETTLNDCRCGCGTKVRRMFAQGHDQVFLAHLRSEVSAGRMTSDAAMAQASTISGPFVQKVAKSMAIVAGQKAREARKESPKVPAPRAA
jgi:hypothetical protein